MGFFDSTSNSSSVNNDNRIDNSVDTNLMGAGAGEGAVVGLGDVTILDGGAVAGGFAIAGQALDMSTNALESVTGSFQDSMSAINKSQSLALGFGNDAFKFAGNALDEVSSFSDKAMSDAFEFSANQQEASLALVSESRRSSDENVMMSITKYGGYLAGALVILAAVMVIKR